MRLLLFICLFSAFLSRPALADSCDSYRTPPQVLEGLTSDQPLAQLSAKTCGLESDDPLVRGVILQQLLTGLSTMAFNVAPQPEDTVGAAIVTRLPQFTAVNITWTKDGKSFAGRVAATCCAGVVGQFLGESVGIDFAGVSIQPASQSDQAITTSCSATLALPKNGTQLQGLLQCTGVKPLFVITLGL